MSDVLIHKSTHYYYADITVCCFRSSSCSLVDIAKSWSDKCAIASSFTLSLSLNELLSSSSSCTLLCISAPCLSSWWMLRKVKYGSIFLNNSAFSDSFLRQYVEPLCPMNH